MAARATQWSMRIIVPVSLVIRAAFVKQVTNGIFQNFSNNPILVIQYCDSNPCIDVQKAATNNSVGTCQNYVNGYNCICTAGFNGPTCADGQSNQIFDEFICVHFQT